MKNNTAYFFVFMFWVFSVNAQSKKEQIENLNYQIDSLHNILNAVREYNSINLKEKERLIGDFRTELELLKDSFLIFQTENITNNQKNDSILVNLTNEIRFLRAKNDSLVDDNSWKFNCERTRFIEDCIDYDMLIPYVEKAPVSDSIINKINDEINRLGFYQYFPKIMSDYDYSKFLKELDCKKEFETWEVRVCDAPIGYTSDVIKIEHKKYLSIVNEIDVHYCGSTVSKWGFLSMNIRLSDYSTIEFVETKIGKEKLIEDVSNYYQSMPKINSDDYGQNWKYDVVKSISKWRIDDLTFYFDDNQLFLIFSDGATRRETRTHEIPLPIFQEYLNL